MRDQAETTASGGNEYFPDCCQIRPAPGASAQGNLRHFTKTTNREAEMLKNDLLITAAMVAVLLASPAAAQTAPANDTAGKPQASGDTNILKEIVVTAARRRNENVQSVPVAITAVTAAALERDQISSAAQLSRIAPNLIIQRQLSTANQVDIYMRGFGNISNDPAIDPPIALYVDGIYQPYSGGTSLDTFGLQNIEVERGPQGTLLGKNAPTGALSFTSRRPTGEFDGAAEIAYERFDHKEAKARLDLPTINNLVAINASIDWRQGGNYIRDTVYNDDAIFGGEDVIAGRVGILVTPASNFEWLVQLNGEVTHNPQTGMRDLSAISGGPYQQIGLTCALLPSCKSTPFQNSADYTRPTYERDGQVSSTATWKLTPLTVTAVTGFKGMFTDDRDDVDGEPIALLNSYASQVSYTFFSQELRLSSARNGGLDLGGHLDWVLGGYFSDYKYHQFQILDTSAVGGGVGTSAQAGTARSYALFAHVVLDITDKLNITLGGRQSWDDKTHDYRESGDTITYIDDPLKYRNFSKEAGIQYKFTSDKNVYFRYAEGYRSGGYQGLPPVAGEQKPYLPETVRTYELGFKGDFLDHRVRTNVDVFQSDYDNLQRTSILAIPISPYYGQFIDNAANAKVRGVEAEMTFLPVEQLAISTTATYLDPKYEHYVVALISGQPAADHSDFPFPYASRWTFKFAPLYTAPLHSGAKIQVGADATYSSTYYTGEVPYPSGRVAPMVMVNAQIQYTDPSDHWYAKVYGQNLTNHHYIENYTTQPTAPGSYAFFSIGVDAKPVTWGIAIGRKF
jgi:iron complex outermembrane recepter protein